MPSYPQVVAIFSQNKSWLSSKFWGYHQIKPFGGPRLLGGFKLASFEFQIFRIESKKESTELFSRRTWGLALPKLAEQEGQVLEDCEDCLRLPQILRSLRKFGWILRKNWFESRYPFWLVVTGTMEFFMTFHENLGISCSQLIFTPSFFRGRFQPPTSFCLWKNLFRILHATCIFLERAGFTDVGNSEKSHGFQESGGLWMLIQEFPHFF